MTTQDEHEGRGVSRRQVLAGAGAVVGGVGLASAPLDDALAAGGTAVASGPQGSTVVEFRGRIHQTGDTGQAFTSYGYVIRATHTRRSDLFDGAKHNETTALLTVFATGDLRARVLDQSVHSLDIVGAMTVYQRKSGGADFSNPASFRVGRKVARYDVLLQDVLTVYAPQAGLPTLSGDMVQTLSATLRGPLAGRPFGHRGARLRMFANGLGQLIDPATFRANFEIAGNWSVE
jgi:hypothetical protein